MSGADIFDAAVKAAKGLMARETAMEEHLQELRDNGACYAEQILAVLEKKLVKLMVVMAQYGVTALPNADFAGAVGERFKHLTDLLKAAEWAARDSGHDEPACPWCGGLEPGGSFTPEELWGHTSDCAWVAAAGKETGE